MHPHIKQAEPNIKNKERKKETTSTNKTPTHTPFILHNKQLLNTFINQLHNKGLNNYHYLIPPTLSTNKPSPFYSSKPPHNKKIQITYHFLISPIPEYKYPITILFTK